MLVFAMLPAILMISAPPIKQDPSLATAAMCGAPTLSRAVVGGAREHPIVLLDYKGAVLSWDVDASAFHLTLDGRHIQDLVTGTDDHGRSSFAGLWSGGIASVSGCVDDPSGPIWVVDIKLPGSKPARYTVVSSDLLGWRTLPIYLTARPVVLEAQSCDCSDGIGLSCTTTDCRNAGSCSAGTATCKFVAVGLD